MILLVNPGSFQSPLHATSLAVTSRIVGGLIMPPASSSAHNSLGNLIGRMVAILPAKPVLGSSLSDLGVVISQGYCTIPCQFP